MLATAALHRRPQLQLKTDSAQQSADCRVIKAEMAIFTTGEQVGLPVVHTTDLRGGRTSILFFCPQPKSNLVHFSFKIRESTGQSSTF